MTVIDKDQLVRATGDALEHVFEEHTIPLPDPEEVVIRVIECVAQNYTLSASMLSIRQITLVWVLIGRTCKTET